MSPFFCIMLPCNGNIYFQMLLCLYDNFLVLILRKQVGYTRDADIFQVVARCNRETMAELRGRIT